MFGKYIIQNSSDVRHNCVYKSCEIRLFWSKTVMSNLVKAPTHGTVNYSYQGIANHSGGSSTILITQSGKLTEEEITDVTIITEDAPVTPSGPNVCINQIGPSSQFFQEFLRVIEDLIDVPPSKLSPNRLITNRTCLGCKAPNIDITFLKCGHCLLCTKCATSMEVMKCYYKTGVSGGISNPEFVPCEYRIRCPSCGAPITKIAVIR